MSPSVNEAPERTKGTAGAPSLEAMRAELRAALPNVAIDFNMRYYAESGPHQYFREHLHLPDGDGPTIPVGVIDTGVGAIAALVSECSITVEREA